MDNSSTDNQLQLQALAHEVCRNHSARPERDLYRICPSKLSKRELEDLYFALLENNLDLKRTINSQNEKLKMLSTKVQRLSANKTPGSKDKDCCHSKTLINEHKDSITELRKCNERMAERIRILNMRLCSAKQFLKKQPPEQKTGTKSQLKNATNFQNFKKVCDHSKPHQAAIEYKISKSVATSPDNPLVTPRKVAHHECDENKCRTAIEELQQKIKELQEELHHTQFNYASKLHDLEREIRSVMEENVRARADSLALEERGDQLVDRLRAAEGRGDDLETQLAIEKRKVKELETRLKLADNDKNLAKSLDQLTVINEQRDPDESPQPSNKFRPRQSISAPKNDPDVQSAVSYYIPPHEHESQVSMKSDKELKRVEPEVDSLAPVPSQKSYRKDSQASVKTKEPKPRESKTESEFLKPVLEEGPVTPSSSSKGQRKESIAETEDSQRREYKNDLEFLKNELEEELPIPTSEGQRKGSIAEIKEPTKRPGSTGSEFLNPELKEGSSIPPSKGQRKESIAEINETKPRQSKTESEFLKPEIKEEHPISSSKGQRKESISEVKEPTKRRESKYDPEFLNPELKEGPPIPSKGQRKESIAETNVPKPRQSKTESEFLKPELKEERPISPFKDQRKGSIAEVEEPKPQDYKTEPKLLKNELEEGTPTPFASKRKESIEPKPREYRTEPEFSEPEFEEGPPMPSSKSQRRKSVAEFDKEPKRQEYKVEPEFQKNEFEEETPIPSSKFKRKESIVSMKEPKLQEYKNEPELKKNEFEEGTPIPSSKFKRKESIVSMKVRNPKNEPELKKNEFEEGTPIPSSKFKRKESIVSMKEPKLQDKIEPELKKNEFEEGTPTPSKNKRKESIAVNEETKPQESKTKPEFSPILSHRPHRKESLPTVKLEVPTPPKSNYEVKFSKSDDSGYTDPNKSYDGEPEKDEEMLRINRDLLKKIADLKSQLDLLMIAAAGFKKDETAPVQLMETAPSTADTKTMENDSVPTNSLSTHNAKVPNKIEQKQQVQAKTEDKIKNTPSSVKPFSYKDRADHFFSPQNLPSPPLEKTKSLADEKSSTYEDHIERPISYEIQVPRSSLYPELTQKGPQNTQEVKSQPKEERDVKISSHENKVPPTNQGVIQDSHSATMLSSYDIIAQKPRTSDEKILIPSFYDTTKQPNTFEEKMPMSSPYEDTSKNHPYRERLSMSSEVNKAQNRPPFSFEYDVMPRESRSPSYHPYEYKTRNSSAAEDIQDPASYDGKIRKSQIHDDKKLIPEEKMEHKDYVDKKRESLFYKDKVPYVDQKQEPTLYNKVQTPNVKRKNDSLFYDVQRPNLPYEDKIYPDEQKFADDRYPDEYTTPMHGQFDEKRSPSLYAERIEKFSLDDHAPSTSSPYEEKMQKLHDGKLQTYPPEDDKSIRFESYIHMADSGSRDYGSEFPKYQDTAEDDPNNQSQEKRRRSSRISTSKTDDQNGFQIPGPVPSTPKPTPIDRKKRHSFDKTKKRSSEEKTVTILTDEKEPSGYSIYLDKSSISKNESAAMADLEDDEKKNKKEIKKEPKPRASTDFSQVTENSKESKDINYNNKTLQVDSYSDLVWQGANAPSGVMQEQGTQMDKQIENLQAPAGQSRRDSATYTQSNNQPQTYTVPKDAYTQPRRETIDQKTYTQNGTHENVYKKDMYKPVYNQDTYTQVGPQNAQTPRYSRSTSPDNTEKEISSLPDLPQEREIKTTHGYLSPGEKATMTFTDNETNTDNGSLSEGELPGTKKATKSFGEKGVETTSRPVESTTQRMEDVLKAISEELSRCHRLLEGQKRDERTKSEVTKSVEDEGVQLRASQGTRRLTGAHHVCVFTLHIGTLVLSDEAVLQSRDKSLVLTWGFYDQSVTMTRMRAGRVVVIDFSTEYDVVFSEDFMNYMKYEKMTLMICEINKQDKPFATCSLPLRDALLHVNRRADMSLAITVGPGGDPTSSSEELGVLDLWCILRCDAVITQHLTKSMARSPSNLGNRNSFHNSLIGEEDLSNERLSEDLDLKLKKESRGQESFSKNMPLNNKKSYSGYLPQEEVSHQGETTAADDLSIGTIKMNKRRSSLGHPRLNERKDVSFDATSNWATSKFASHPNATGLIANAVPSNIRSTEEMKAALERNAIQEETRKMPKIEDKSLSRKPQLSKLKFTKRLSEDVNISSLQDMINNRSKASDRTKNGQPYYDLAPNDKFENELAKKYNDITKLMVSRMDAAKKSVKYSDDDEQPQRGVGEEDPPAQSIEITVLWLALNEECDAMVNPNIKRLYVAYKFLGRTGAELETPVSLPKPKHYVDKCYFNFKKTFNLHDADLPALGHMARVRAGSRVSTDPRDCLVFTVVSEPPEDPLGLSSCEDVGYAYLYLGDILAYSSGSGAYTEVVAVHAARGSAVCGVLAIKIDGLHVLRRALSLSHSAKDLERPVMAY